MAVTILLVEDEAIIALQERQIIENSGYDVILCPSGEEAIDTVNSNENISLILMDIDLGQGMDGTRAAEEILKIKDIPIVFLTSHSEKEMVDKVKNITKYGYIIKATGQFVLLETINTALELFNANSALKKSEIEYKEIVEGIDSAILKFDDQGRIIYFSRGAEKIFGYQADEVIGKLSIETINPVIDSNGSSHENLLKTIFKDPESFTINENENRTKDGRRLWMRWFNKAVYDHNGEKMYILGIGTDLTESKDRYNRVKSSENLFHTAFRNSSAMMSITKLSDGTYIAVNDEFLRQTGYTKEDCIGQTSTELGVMESSCRDAKFNNVQDERAVLHYSLKIKAKSGKILYSDYTGVIIEINGEKHLLSISYLPKSINQPGKSEL